MGQAERGHIQHEIENEADRIFPGRLRRVELLQHGDAPMTEPGQLVPTSVFADPAGGREGRPRREAYEYCGITVTGRCKHGAHVLLST
jgi:hypothetical protein